MYIFADKNHTKHSRTPERKEEAFMEETRKRLRACLIFVVTVAVIIGMVYYFHDVKGGTQISEGTLIFISGGDAVWRW